MNPAARALSIAAIAAAGCAHEPPRPHVAVGHPAPEPQPPPRTTALALGSSFSCALGSDGTVRCWGANGSGQLGDGTRRSRPSPVRVIGVEDAVQVASGDGQACALRRDGTVWCWGENSIGLELVSIEAPGRLTPARIEGLGSTVRIGVGEDSACALDASGAIRCWGLNGDGELGDGTTTSHRSPARVAGLPPAVGLSVGPRQSCAVLGDGAAWCWGRTAQATRSPPRAIPGLAGVTEVAVSWAAACALVAGGEVYCWGDGNFGSLGDGKMGGRSPTPTRVLQNRARRGDHRGGRQRVRAPCRRDGELLGLEQPRAARRRHRHLAGRACGHCRAHRGR